MHFLVICDKMFDCSITKYTNIQDDEYNSIGQTLVLTDPWVGQMECLIYIPLGTLHQTRGHCKSSHQCASSANQSYQIG